MRLSRSLNKQWGVKAGVGSVIHHYMSIHSFFMGVLWFSAFILLGLLIRKLRFPVKFSVAPLFLLLVLSVFRMLIFIDVPGSVIIALDTGYPAVLSVLRHEVIPQWVLGFPVNLVNLFICIWIVTALFLGIKHFYNYFGKLGPMLNWLGRSTRDKYAEAMLADIVGHDKYFRVFRNKNFKFPKATALKPYIILPDVVFSPDGLRIILLHEWKHIEDKDYLATNIINIICFVFWWNPLVYVLKKNFSFAQELKCDQYAISGKNDFLHFLDALTVLGRWDKQKMDFLAEDAGANSFISDDDELLDRLKVLARQSQSRIKRILFNICFSVVVFALFIGSYMFIAIPVFSEVPDVPVSAECFMGEEAFRADEIFLVDNGDGTFSFYVDGQFVGNTGAESELFDFLPIRAREYK